MGINEWIAPERPVERAVIIGADSNRLLRNCPETGPVEQPVAPDYK